VADEYGPSILVVAADGVVQARWVPEGEGAALAGAAYASRTCCLPCPRADA
jgi:hypothetical protein